MFVRLDSTLGVFYCSSCIPVLSELKINILVLVPTECNREREAMTSVPRRTTFGLARLIAMDAGELDRCAQMREEEWDVLHVISIALPFHSYNFLLIHSP